MNVRSLRIAFTILLFVLMAPTVASGAIKIPVPGGGGIPNPGDIIGDLTDIDSIVNNLPGFGLSMDQEEPVTTSLDDAVTDLPFLDGYPMSPVIGDRYFLPICELRMGIGGGNIIMPGRYEVTVNSYCLHAGKYGPGHGSGYLYAPLKGPWAYMIEDILENSSDHPEIPQHDTQTLIWAVLARTSLSDMNPDMQKTARILMPEKDIKEINKGAFGIIPQDKMDEVFKYVDAPPEIEEIMRSEAEIRSMVSDPTSSFDEIEQVAVLAGNPPPGNDRDISFLRWSYHPDGYFIRYDPNGYSETHIEIAIPDKFAIEPDSTGKIISIENEHGRRLVVNGSKLFFQWPDPEDPDNTLDKTWSGFNTTGIPSRWVSEHRAEIVRVCGEKGRVDDLVEIGKFAKAVEMASGTGDAALMAQDFAKEAWMDGMLRIMQPKWSEKHMFGGRIAKDLPDWDWHNSYREFHPDGTATPANRGSQRLALDPRPSQDPNWGDVNLPTYDPGKKPQANDAREAMNKFNNASDTLSWLDSGVVGGIANTVGFAIPNAVFGGMLEFTMSLWDFCTGAISMDPPRDDYTEIAEPSHFIFAPLVSPQDGPPARVEALNDLMTECLDLAGWLQAAQISVDRHGGAVLAGDKEWAWKQAKAVIYLERQAGYCMYFVANTLDAYVEELRTEGIQDIYIKADDIRDHQEELRQNGFSQEELDAAHLFGFTDEMIQTYLEYRLSIDPDEAAGSIMESAEELADALRAYGQYLITLPDIPDSDFAAGFPSVKP